MNRKKWGTNFLAGMLFIACLLFPSFLPTAPTAFAASPSASQTPELGGKINILSSSVPFILPIPMIPAPVASYLLPVVEPLVGQDMNGRLAPTKLATGWKFSDDGKSLTLTLRKGVKFQDGTPFNADAVKFNLDRSIGFRAELMSLKSVDVLDDYTVRLNLKYYSNTLLWHLSWVAGMIESPHSIKNNDRRWFTRNAIGTGPFRLASFDPPNSMVFTKFEGYWDAPKPYLDEIRYTFIIDPVTAELSFRAGDAQIWDQVLPKSLKSIDGQGYKVNTAPRTIWVALGDVSNPNSPLANVKVRQAIEHAIDKEAVVKAFGFNTWETPHQVASSVQTGYIANFQGRRYDPDRARKLLAEAGYPRGFKTKLTVRNNFDTNVMGIYQAYLKAVGIDAELIPADTGKYRSLLSKGWDGILLNGLGVAGPVVKMLETDAPNSNWCVSSPMTDNYRDALAKAIAAPTQSSWEKLSQDLVRVVYDDAILIPWNIDSVSCVYIDSVHTDLNVVSLQWWNPGDTWISQGN